MSKISGKAANEMENYLFMYNDFILESLKFIQKNIDKILMVTVIMFLVMAWTIIFEWEMPKEKNVVFKKTISLEGFKTKDQLLTEELIKDCDDELCKNHNNCLGKESYEFIDLLNQSDTKIWQVLPLGITDKIEFSPYSSKSSVLGNPYIVSLDNLGNNIYNESELNEIKLANGPKISS